MVVGRQQSITHAFGDILSGPQPIPQLGGPRKILDFIVHAGEEIVLDDAVAVCRVCKFQPQNLRVFLGLLKTIAGGSVDCLRLNNSDGKVPAVPEQVVRTLLRAANSAIPDEHDAAVGEALLLADLRAFPARAVQLREKIRAACVGFV